MNLTLDKRLRLAANCLFSKRLFTHFIETYKAIKSCFTRPKPQSRKGLKTLQVIRIKSYKEILEMKKKGMSNKDIYREAYKEIPPNEIGSTNYTEHFDDDSQPIFW